MSTFELILIGFDILGRDAVYQINGWKPIYFISMVGTDASDRNGKGVPREALSFFDIFSEMEFEDVDGITFLSIQDLLKFYHKQTKRNMEDGPFQSQSKHHQ